MDTIFLVLFFSILIWSINIDKKFFLIFFIIIIFKCLSSIFFKKNSKLFNNIFEKAKNPTIRSIIKVDIDKIDKFLKIFNNKNKTKITYTHIAIKALSEGMLKYKKLNSYISYNQSFEIDATNIAIVVNVKEKDLVFKVLRNTEKMNINEIPYHLRKGIKSIKKQKNKKINLFNYFIKNIPSYLLAIIGRINFFIFHSFLARINMNIIQKNLCFGAITNVSSFNIFEATACHIELIKSSIILLLGTPKKMPIVQDGKIIYKKIMNVGISCDQRLGNGDDFLLAIKKIENVFLNFEKYL